MSSVLEITDIGPIEHLAIPCPDEGGIVVLSGRNGAGKTTALNAVDSIVSGNTTVTPRDGCSRGEIDAFGATLRVGKRSSRSGELEVTSLDGRLSPAQLVDPGLKSADAADAVRIKALLQLAGAKPQVSDFFSLVGTQEQFEQAVPESLADIDDVVTLAAKIKRSLEAEARRREATAENEAGKAAAYRKGIEDLDLSSVPDAAELNQRLESAIRHESTLTEQALMASRLRAEAADARAKLSETEHLPADLSDTIAEAETALKSANAILTGRKEMVDQAKAALAQAEAALEDAEREFRVSSERQASAALRLAELNERQQSETEQRERYDAAVAGWKASIEAAEAAECPTVDEIEAAENAVKVAREAIEQAAVMRRAVEQAAKADEHDATAKSLVKQATALRDAAKGTDDILSDLVGRCGTPLIVRGGRLYLETRRGLTEFRELSHGERWKVAIDVALQAFPADAEHTPILTIPQEAWEGLDPPNRAVIAEHARDRHVLILTAECSDADAVTANQFN